MTLQIRPLVKDDIAAVVELSLLAWEPVFDSFRHILGDRIFSHMFPDWRAHQTREVTNVCHDPASMVFVADVAGVVAGFITCKLNHDTETGEVEFLAMHPDYHNRGIGTELNHFALELMREKGMKLAFVGTGGDPAHAAARHVYEKAGYIAIPNVLYYQYLSDESAV